MPKAVVGTHGGVAGRPSKDPSLRGREFGGLVIEWGARDDHRGSRDSRGAISGAGGALVVKFLPGFLGIIRENAPVQPGWKPTRASDES